ncbi:unnamed protein product [Merluccius merluccius]
MPLPLRELLSGEASVSARRRRQRWSSGSSSSSSGISCLCTDNALNLYKRALESAVGSAQRVTQREADVVFRHVPAPLLRRHRLLSSPRPQV